jgi:hypothetical protein
VKGLPSALWNVEHTSKKVHTRIHTYTHTHIHTYTHTHIHTYTHIITWPLDSVSATSCESTLLSQSRLLAYRGCDVNVCSVGRQLLNSRSVAIHGSPEQGRHTPLMDINCKYIKYNNDFHRIKSKFVRTPYDTSNCMKLSARQNIVNLTWFVAFRSIPAAANSSTTLTCPFDAA